MIMMRLFNEWIDMSLLGSSSVLIVNGLVHILDGLDRFCVAHTNRTEELWSSVKEQINQ